MALYLVPNSKKAELFEIESTYELPPLTPATFLTSVQEVVLSMIPEEFFFPSLEPESLFYHLTKQMPLFRSLRDLRGVNTIPVTAICSGAYTRGVGRYISDCLARWLIPGKFCSLCGEISLNFRFKAHQGATFYLTQKMVRIEDPEDLLVAQKNLFPLLEEMRITIMAVYHARYISSIRSTNPDNQTLIMEETLSSILKRDTKPDASLFDQFKGLFTKIESEEKSEQIRKTFNQLSTKRPKTFDRDLFYDVAQSVVIFGEAFYQSKQSRFISRVIAYLYLFRKMVQDRVEKLPMERHAHLKILTESNSHRSTLSLIFGFNFLSDEERFETKHLLAGLQTCLPTAELIETSLIQDRRHEALRLLYVEIKKKDSSPFNFEELKKLKQTLSQELIKQIKTAFTPIFMPRNEEEILRGIIVLSKQIKYVRDLPQVSIHYEAQSKGDISFTVIIVQLLKGLTPPLRKSLSGFTEVVIEIDDIRSVGSLKKKYVKEAAIVRMKLEKAPFLRPDSSVDILRARQKIVFELTKALGELRDFNGGIILKQDEALSALRKTLSPLSSERDLLVENYFYSLRPGIMQAVYETTILQAHFQLFEKMIGSESLFMHEVKGKYLLVFFKGPSDLLKRELMEAVQLLKIPSQDLSTTLVEVEQISYLGLIYRFNYDKEKEVFLSCLYEVTRR